MKDIYYRERLLTRVLQVMTSTVKPQKCMKPATWKKDIGFIAINYRTFPSKGGGSMTDGYLYFFAEEQQLPPQLWGREINPRGLKW